MLAVCTQDRHDQAQEGYLSCGPVRLMFCSQIRRIFHQFLRFLSFAAASIGSDHVKPPIRFSLQRSASLREKGSLMEMKCCREQQGQKFSIEHFPGFAPEELCHRFIPIEEGHKVHVSDDHVIQGFSLGHDSCSLGNNGQYACSSFGPFALIVATFGPYGYPFSVAACYRALRAAPNGGDKSHASSYDTIEKRQRCMRFLLFKGLKRRGEGT